METKRYTESDGYWIEARPRIEDGLVHYDLLAGRGDVAAKHSAPLCKPQQLPSGILHIAPRGISIASHFWAGVALRQSAFTWIGELWNECQASVNAAITAEDSALNAIPGYRELSAAIADEERYRAEFNAMMEDECNDGVRPPKPVRDSSTALAAEFTLAAMLIRAESYAAAAHWAKAKAGEEAEALILAGGTAEEAGRILENWMADNRVEVN